MLFGDFYYKLATILYQDGSCQADMIMQRNPFKKWSYSLPGGTKDKIKKNLKNDFCFQFLNIKCSKVV